MATITNQYTERTTLFKEDDTFENVEVKHTFETETTIPKLGVMLAGLGGNNGTTFYAGILANKKNMSWEAKTGTQTPNYYGSFTQCATAKVGNRFVDGELKDVFKPVKELVPLVDPNDFIVGGWDISGMNLYEAARRAQVLEPDLVRQMKEELESVVPMKAAFNQEFIASNQADRVDNVIEGTNKEVIEQLKQDIRDFKAKCDKVIVLWTANTEKNFYPVIDTTADMEKLIDSNASVPASVLYAYACIMEGVTFLNGSPQNTLHPAIIELATANQTFIGGSDFKSGQTRFKTIMSDFLIGAGLKLQSIASYNHLGNNDGKNLAEPETFKSKQISKSSVLDDAISSNPILYPNGHKGFDHEVVIKYLPFVGDSKRALDEYSSVIFLNGINTISSFNVCEDSLLATPIMYDLIVLAELFTRMKIDGEKLGPLLSYLSFFFKAPVTNHPEYVINSFTRQRESLTNLLKAAGGYTPDDGTLLNFKF